MTEYPTPTDDPRRSESFSCRLGPKSPWTALHLSLCCGGHINFSFLYWGQLRWCTHLEPSSFSKTRSLLSLEVTRLRYGETLFLMCFLTCFDVNSATSFAFCLVFWGRGCSHFHIFCLATVDFSVLDLICEERVHTSHSPSVYLHIIRLLILWNESHIKYVYYCHFHPFLWIN